MKEWEKLEHPSSGSALKFGPVAARNTKHKVRNINSAIQTEKRQILPKTPNKITSSPLTVTYSGSGKDRILSCFHYYLVDRCTRALSDLVLMEFLTDSWHCGLRTVLRIRRIWSIICVSRWQCKPHNARSWLRRGSRQSVPSIGWRNLIMTIKTSYNY